MSGREQIVLILNAGSSSIKFAVFSQGNQPGEHPLLCEGQMAGIGHAISFRAHDANRQLLIDRQLDDGVDHQHAMETLLDWLLSAFSGYRLIGAGHRVVHGGARYHEPVLIDAEVLTELRHLIPLAPLHQPHHITAIELLQKMHPDLPQIACFDTAFHSTNTELTTLYALPAQLRQSGVRRYGFHGLSYEYIASVLELVMGNSLANGRIVVAHLGAGASMCALWQKKSVASSMGFTALDGLPMGKRCGSIDPGIVLYLMQEQHLSADQISHLLYNESGLLGVSGISDDMKTLLDSREPAAAQAVDLFAYRISRELGSLAAALGGLDALVFTAGIGEHAAALRSKVVQAGAWLGLALDPDANAAGAARISPPGAKTPVWVIPTDEDLMIARHTWQLLEQGE